MHILAIDPGETESHFVIWDTTQVKKAWSGDNEDLLRILRDYTKDYLYPDLFIAVEGYNPRGQRLGHNALSTIEWYTRFFQCVRETSPRLPCSIVRRAEVWKHITGKGSGVGDSEIMHTLIDRFGDKPTKKRPNKVYGDIKLRGDQWQAFALAVTVADRLQRVNTRLEE
jgi:hypothetical protein